MTTCDADGGAPSSRRTRREAEREQERELLRTGQMPVLTRKEIRRQRAEAEAMRNAIAAGEITEEEARALQNPYLNEDAPVAPAPDDEAGTASAPVRRAVLRVPAAQGLRRLDPATGELSAVEPVGEGFGGIGTPQWQAIVPDAVAGGEDAPTVAMPDAATGAGLPDEPGTRLTEAAVGASQEDDGRGRRAVIALLVLVAVLAVIVVCWFVIHQAGGSSAAAARLDRVGAGQAALAVVIRS